MYETWEKFMADMIALGESLSQIVSELCPKEEENAEAFRESGHSWPQRERVTRENIPGSRRSDVPDWYQSGFR